MAAIGKLKIDVTDSEVQKTPTPPPSPEDKSATDDKVKQVSHQAKSVRMQEPAKHKRPSSAFHIRKATPMTTPTVKSKDDNDAKEDDCH